MARPLCPRAGAPRGRRRRVCSAIGLTAGLLGSFVAGVGLAAPGKTAGKAANPAVAQFGRAVEAFRAGSYESAARLLDGLSARLPRTRDYVHYYAGESEFFAGRPKAALVHFRELERDKASRLREVAAYRVADCLWSAGDKEAAAAAYRRLLGASAEGERPSPKLSRTRFNAFVGTGGVATDPVVGRFRIATLLGEAKSRDGSPDLRARARAARAFRAIHVEFPAHPLADDAARRADVLEPKPATTPVPEAGGVSVPDRLARADVLAEQRRFADAVVELERLPASLPAPYGAERDFQLGMTVFRMRNDYGRAAKLLLAAVDGLSGDKAETALFHGTRALSRVHKDDDAIVGYRRFVERFPNARLAPEASFLAGWLDFNRGRYREAQSSFDETVRRFPRNPFAVKAAWFTALGHLLMGDGDATLAALDRYGRLANAGADSDVGHRISFYRGRALYLAKREAEGRSVYEDLARRAPFSYYGIMARVRLREARAPLALELPAYTGRALGLGRVNDALVARADELFAAGLVTEAGVELLRGEAGLIARLGKDRALALLFDRYPRFFAWRRAFQLADAHGDAALAAKPEGTARIFWTASYPRAFSHLVDRFGPDEGNPDLFVYAIMRKESAFLPSEVSYADARGLLQVLPELGAELAAELGMSFAPDELFVPETAIRLGARYTGGLAKKFRGNLALAAGAYNAGGRAVTRWCDRNGKMPLDDFIELVTFDDTRLYMKLVLEIYARYHYLYRGRPFAPALEVEGCKYDPGGREN